jgi:uncharacterized protein (DUF433 family)
VRLAENIRSGSGLYTLSEAAQYARMHPITLSRWFKGDDYCKRVFSVEDSKAINFLDFVQVLAVRNLRVIYNIELQKIRDAVDHASKEFNVQYPFARRHTTFLFENEIWIRPEGKTITQLSGKEHGQTGITQVIERFYEDVSFDPKTGFANLYKAYESRGNKIIMNPRIRFGEPMLENCGYTPQALFEAAKTEGSAEAAARSYGVSVGQVQTSIDYIDYLTAA